MQFLHFDIKMKILVGLVVLAFVFEASLTEKHRRRNVMNDAVLLVEPLPPDFVSGECTCRCCDEDKPDRKFFSIIVCNFLQKCRMGIFLS